MKIDLSRRNWLKSVASAATATVVLGAIVTPTQAVDIASFRDTLRTGLKCRRDVEFTFVDKIVALVQTGKLPEDLVLNTMRWAQEKREDIPFPYFVQGIRRRAALLNVKV